MKKLFSTEQIRKIDSLAINKFGIPSQILMENAAMNIYLTTLNQFNFDPKVHQIGFICGKGNNGGDGFAAARHFLNNNFKVVVIHLFNKNEMSQDAKLNFEILTRLQKADKNIVIKKYKTEADLNLFSKCTALIDAILGSGSTGELNSSLKNIISKLNALELKRIAIDIPTGLNSNSGFGEIIFNADFTITLAGLKKGLFYGEGFISSGIVEKADIGFGANILENLPVDSFLFEASDCQKLLPIKKKDSNKYSTGKILMIAGSKAYPGAAELAAISALRTGAGAVILAFPNSCKGLLKNKYPELLLHYYDDKKDGFLSKEHILELKTKIIWADVISIGPGLGRNVKTIDAVNFLMQSHSSKKYVIDADAIFAISEKRFSKLNLKNSIITPHMGEFSNLLGIAQDIIMRDRIFYSKQFAKKTGAVLLLKGSRTLVTENSNTYIIESGNEGLAKIGSGDVLTGVISGFLAQKSACLNAALLGAFLHGATADLQKDSKSVYGFTASDLSYNLHNTFKKIISNDLSVHRKK